MSQGGKGAEQEAGPEILEGAGRPVEELEYVRAGTGVVVGTGERHARAGEVESVGADRGQGGFDGAVGEEGREQAGGEAGQVGRIAEIARREARQFLRHVETAIGRDTGAQRGSGIDQRSLASGRAIHHSTDSTRRPAESIGAS